jgi:AcrR family transcriptional regulator
VVGDVDGSTASYREAESDNEADDREDGRRDGDASRMSRSAQEDDSCEGEREADDRFGDAGGRGSKGREPPRTPPRWREPIAASVAASTIINSAIPARPRSARLFCGVVRAISVEQPVPSGSYLPGRARLGQLEDREDAWVVELVADAGALLLSGDDPRPPQDAQMLRDVLLGRPERVNEFLHRCRPSREAVDELDTQRLTEYAQALRDQTRCTIRECPLKSHYGMSGPQSNVSHPRVTELLSPRGGLAHFSQSHWFYSRSKVLLILDFGTTATMSTGLRERKKEQTRQAIREAALRLFAERGFDGVTVAEIASAADVSVATLFNYFPTKEDLVYARMETFEADLITAIREREPGETVLAAFGRFILNIGGLLASNDAEASERLAAIARIVTASPALLAREREISAHYTQSLAALIAEETEAVADDLTPSVAANALMGVHRAMLGQVRSRLLARTPNQRLARDIHSGAAQALLRLERGLGDYAIKQR